MNEFKGTPGPWELDGVEIYPVAGHRASDAICAMQPGFIDADAALIAAAPDLLKGLRDLLEAYESVMHSEFDYPGDPWTAEGRHDDDDAIAAKAVIAKALGEKP